MLWDTDKYETSDQYEISESSRDSQDFGVVSRGH